MRPSDRDLLRLMAVDPDAFEVFYRRHVETLTRFVARRVTNPSDLADVVAEVFVAVIESGERFDRRRTSALPWLFGIARNRLSEQRRSEQRARSAIGASGREPTADEFLLLEERIDAQRVAPALLRALDELPERDRALLEMVALDELTVASAADRLGMSPTAARMRLSRLRRRLREVLSPDPRVHEPAGATSKRQEMI